MMTNLSPPHSSFLSYLGQKSFIKIFPSCLIFTLILFGYFSMVGGIMIGLGGTMVYHSSQHLIKRTN